jgi:hypothetical protein
MTNLIELDDYLVHQAPLSLTVPSTDDPNFFDRYYIAGHDLAGTYYFGVAVGLYPNLQVMDASFSIVFDGMQYALHASTEIGNSRKQITIGPIQIIMQKPMRQLRIKIDARNYDMSADLILHAAAQPIMEAPFTDHISQNYQRYTQFGNFEGYIKIKGRTFSMGKHDSYGYRDHAWGVRPLGESLRNMNIDFSKFHLHWNWLPLRFDDRFLHAGIYEANNLDYRFASMLHLSPTANRKQRYQKGQLEELQFIERSEEWDNKNLKSATILLATRTGEVVRIFLQPLRSGLIFNTYGLGYSNSEWSHGLKKGKNAVGYEEWPCTIDHTKQKKIIHHQIICQASMGTKSGFGIYEYLLI